MVEISNNYNIAKTQNLSKSKTNNIHYATNIQNNYDKLDLSEKGNKKENKNKLKLLIGGAIAAIGVVFIGIKTHKFIKNKKFKQIAETEAERLKTEAEEKAKKEAERLKAEAEKKARIEAEEKARIEAEEKARIEAEEKARIEAEEKARIEAEEKVRIEAEEKARIEAEEKAKIEAEEKARIEAEEKAKIEAEEKARIEAEEKARIEAEEKARTETEIKTTGIQRPKNLTKAINKGLDFGEDLSKLVEEKNATPEEIQKLVSKHFNSDKIYVHSMSEYNNFGPTGINKERKAATTRPSFNENGKLEKIDLFIPDLDYQNKENVIEYLDKTTHEFTHVAQFLSGNTSKLEYVYPTIEGRIFNYIQKNITDKMTDKMFEDSLMELIKESNEKLKNASDLNKFLDKPSNSVTKEHLGELLKLGKDKHTQKVKINEIFNYLYDIHIQQMSRDPNVYDLMQKSGGYEGFRNKIKTICFNTFKNEQEAYKAGQMMRQKINGTTNQTTNNDLQNLIMEMCADALK